jgi:hypothetical protein
MFKNLSPRKLRKIIAKKPKKYRRKDALAGVFRGVGREVFSVSASINTV